MDSSKPSVTIIGIGSLGSTLELFFKDSGYRIRSKWNSTGGTVFFNAPDRMATVLSTFPEGDEEIGELVFITTPDDTIAKTAASLSDKSINWKERTIVHCSGNLTSDELKALSDKGAKTVSMHPIQTFRKGDGKERFENIFISIQGDPKAQKQLKTVIEEMHATPVFLDKKQKRILHIAAVMASNYLVALMYNVENLLNVIQSEDGLRILQGLIYQTTENIFANGSVKALTGPISRGDVESVRTHLEELKRKEQENVYKVLGLETLKVAEKSGNLSQKQLDRLKQLLEKE